MVETATETEHETETTERVALSPSGRRSVISAYADLEERAEPRGWQREVLIECYGALMRHAGSHSIRDLRNHFESFGTEEPKQGIYASPTRWWEVIGRNQLLSLPGVEPTADGGVEFVGIEPDAIEDTRGISEADTVGLDEHRNAPRTRVLRALDAEHDPHGERYSQLLVLVDALADADEPVSPEAIRRDYRLPSLDDGLGDDLAALPHVEYSRVNVTAADITIGPGEDVETLADLNDAMERVEAGPETRYRYDPDGEV